MNKSVGSFSLTKPTIHLEMKDCRNLSVLSFVQKEKIVAALD